MMNSNNDKIVERIKSLLAIADDQKGMPEGEVASKIAEKLMRQHAITQEQLCEKEVIVKINLEIGRSNWLRNLLHYVAMFCSCKIWIITGTNQVGMAGYEADIEVCQYLFNVIRFQIESECNSYLKNRGKFNPFVNIKHEIDNVGGKKVSNDFKMSAVSGVAKKLTQIKAESQAEDQVGCALVLSRSRVVEDWVNDSIHLRSRAAARYTHNSAGYHAGENVRLTHGINSNGSPKGFGIAPKLLK